MAKKTPDKSESAPEKSFAVDKDSLDEEWVEQPDLFHKYAVKLADARLAIEEAKAELDVTQSELDRDLRADPEAYDIPKVTETALSNAILLQPEYKKALAKVNQARHHQDILQAAVTALDHRKKALENLVFLHGQSYFSSPRARGEDAEGMREAEKKSVRSRVKLTREQMREEDE